MALEFIQKTYNWALPIAVGPQFWLTDFAAAPGAPDAVNWPLPDWLPRKLFVVRCWMRREIRHWCRQE